MLQYLDYETSGNVIVPTLAAKNSLIPTVVRGPLQSQITNNVQSAVSNKGLPDIEIIVSHTNVRSVSHHGYLTTPNLVR
jgi:hypothetical protein